MQHDGFPIIVQKGGAQPAVELGQIDAAGVAPSANRALLFLNVKLVAAVMAERAMKKYAQ